MENSNVKSAKITTRNVGVPPELIKIPLSSVGLNTPTLARVKKRAKIGGTPYRNFAEVAFFAFYSGKSAKNAKKVIKMAFFALPKMKKPPIGISQKLHFFHFLVEFPIANSWVISAILISYFESLSIMTDP